MVQVGQRKVLDNCPTSPCCPCFQNPVSRGHPAHHPCECPKHKPTLVVSLPRNSAAPVAPRGSHLQLPSTLYCARAPCAAPPSTPLPNTVAVPPPSLRTAGPWAGNACSPTPPQPPCHVGLSSPSVWSQPHSTINICLCVFLSPTHVGSAQAAIKRVTATLAQAMDTRLSGAGESKIKGSGGWVPRKTHFPAFRRHLLCVTSHGRSGRWPGGGREWRERERERSAVSSYKGTNPTQGPHTRDLT